MVRVDKQRAKYPLVACSECFDRGEPFKYLKNYVPSSRWVTLRGGWPWEIVRTCERVSCLLERIQPSLARKFRRINSRKKLCAALRQFQHARELRGLSGDAIRIADELSRYLGRRTDGAG